MARTKLSEFKAKTLLHTHMGLPYSGLQIAGDSLDAVNTLDVSKKYVAKVDEGIKKRNKKGLVKIGLNLNEIKEYIQGLQESGYSQFIVEEMVAHEKVDEKYISIERVREGIRVMYSSLGGVDIEENKESIREVIIPSSTSEEHAISETLGVNSEQIVKLLTYFESYFFSFLEINPLVVNSEGIHVLDIAGEVDSVADFFVNNAWTPDDFTTGEVRMKTDEEKAIEELSLNSQAAFKLDILNPDGSVFMLLSGGGASIVLADEVAAQGFGKMLANYGEYSGNPNMEETYIYTKNIISLLLKSKAEKKVLIIGGGVANFTDIRITFRGIIKALDEVKDTLVDQGVRIYVRRGGPNQKEGLELMKSYLEQNSLYGFVSGPDLVLTDIIQKAAVSLRGES